MSTRNKKPAAAIPQTREEVEALVRELLTMRETQQTLTAEMNEKVRAVSEDYKQGIDAAAVVIAANLAQLELWAVAHKSREFSNARSLTLAGARLGWALSNFKAATQKKATWVTVVDKLKQLIAKARDGSANEDVEEQAGIAASFLRLKYEADKERMIASRHSQQGRAVLGLVGVDIVQDENFFVDPEGTAIPDGKILSSKEAA